MASVKLCTYVGTPEQFMHDVAASGFTGTAFYPGTSGVTTLFAANNLRLTVKSVQVWGGERAGVYAWILSLP